MSNVVVRVDGLSKLYRIGSTRARQRTLRETVTDGLAAPFRRAAAAMQGRHLESGDDELWALRDVSFDIERGDVLGVIGRNGAGKSTLFKILSRITEPTAGRVGLKGRVGSLLEVGTGFHPELTGRENIYLNGAILGMKRADIERRFDEIVAFSELERFLDTQVKHYSSGMYMRLAFAVAAHLEPDILVVDEVLAVGDAAFQKKCIGQMGSTARSGATVLFVSHNMGAINQLCPRTLWLDGGRVAAVGPTDAIIASYLRTMDSELMVDERGPLDPSKDAQFRAAHCVNRAGERTRAFACDDAIAIVVAIHVHRPTRGLYATCDFLRSDGTRLLTCYSSDADPDPLDGMMPGAYELRIAVPERVLGHGQYTVAFSLAKTESMMGVAIEAPRAICTFDIEETRIPSGNRRPGLLSTAIPWTIQALPEPAADAQGRLSP